MKLPALTSNWKRPKSVLGLDIGSHTIKLVELSGNGSDRTLIRIGRALLPPQAIVNGSIKEPERVAASIRALLENLKPKKRHTGTSIAGYSVIVKKISVSYRDEKEIEDNLIFEAEKYVPFEIEDVFIDFQVMGSFSEKSPTTPIFLVAAKREVVDEYANLLQEVNLSPAVVDVDAFALGNAFETAYGQMKEPVALIDIGANKTNLNVVAAGDSLLAKELPTGGYQLTSAIQETMGLSYEEAEKVKIAGHSDQRVVERISESFQETCHMWGRELKKALDYYRTISPPEEQPVKAFLSGGSALIKDLDKILSDDLDLPVAIQDPLRSFTPEQTIDRDYIDSIAPQMAIAAGLALRTVQMK